jgi:hypothetical protein
MASLEISTARRTKMAKVKVEKANELEAVLKALNFAEDCTHMETFLIAVDDAEGLEDGDVEKLTALCPNWFRAIGLMPRWSCGYPVAWLMFDKNNMMVGQIEGEDLSDATFTKKEDMAS